MQTSIEKIQSVFRSHFEPRFGDNPKYLNRIFCERGERLIFTNGHLIVIVNERGNDEGFYPVNIKKDFDKSIEYSDYRYAMPNKFKAIEMDIEEMYNLNLATVSIRKKEEKDKEMYYGDMTTFCIKDKESNESLHFNPIFIKLGLDFLKKFNVKTFSLGIGKQFIIFQTDNIFFMLMNEMNEDFKSLPVIEAEFNIVKDSYEFV